MTAYRPISGHLTTGLQGSAMRLAGFEAAVGADERKLAPLQRLLAIAALSGLLWTVLGGIVALVI